MRRAIDRHPERLKGVLVESRLRKEFLEGAPNNETKAVKAFVAANKENALKTRPKVGPSHLIDSPTRPCLVYLPECERA